MLKKEAEDRKKVLHKKIDEWRSQIIAEDQAKRRVINLMSYLFMFFYLFNCLSLPLVAKRQVNNVKGSSKRFHMESHTMRFLPQTQKLQSGIAE